MKVFPTVCAAALLTTLTLVSAALAQTDFQLPRECLERQVANPERCVIQDGQPRLPVARQVPASAGGTQTPATPATNPAAAPSSAPAPRPSAPFGARR